MQKKPKIKIVKAWGGFVSGKLDKGWIQNENFEDNLLGIFKTRNEAKIHYQDVRKVEIHYKLT